MGIVEMGVGTAIGMNITERKNRILAYKVLSNPNRKIYSKGVVFFTAFLIILSFIVPILLLCMIPKMFTVDEIGGQVGGGLIAGLFVSWIMIAPTVYRFCTKHITMPYHLRNNAKYRWGIGVVYQDEFPSYSAFTKRNDVYILLDRRTDSIINTDVQPLYEKKGKRIFWIIISFLIMCFCWFAYLTSSDETIWIAIAMLMVSVVAFVLAVLRTIKQEY